VASGNQPQRGGAFTVTNRADEMLNRKGHAVDRAHFGQVEAVVSAEGGEIAKRFRTCNRAVARTPSWVLDHASRFMRGPRLQGTGGAELTEAMGHTQKGVERTRLPTVFWPEKHRGLA
jgi:hypothetical protein